MVAKAGLSLLVLGVVGVSTVVFSKPEWLGMDNMPDYKLLSREQNFDSSYPNPKFGHKYGNYFSSTEKDNQTWWEWAYRRLNKDEVTQGKFTNTGNKDQIKVSKPYDDNVNAEGAKALNQVCRAAYGTPDNDFQNSEPEDHNKFKKVDVWRYCSPLGRKPTTVKNYDHKDGTERYKESGGKKPIGKEAEGVLISVFDTNNDMFWDIRNQEFRGEGLFNNKPQTFDDQKHQFFKKKKEEGAHIKDICREVYDQTETEPSTSSKSQASIEETKKFCSLTISNNQ